MVTGGAFEAGNKAEGTGPDDGGGAIWAKEIKVEPSGSDPIVFAGQVARKDGGALFSKTSVRGYAGPGVFKDTADNDQRR